MIHAALLLLIGGQAHAAELLLSAGTAVPLVTAQPLSSKTSAKGDPVALRVVADVVIDGVVVIASGTAATGQVADVRAKGAMGMSGRLDIRPMYLMLGEQPVRLAGGLASRGKTEGGAIVGMALLTPGFTGRSAIIPAGTAVPATVERSTAVIVRDSPAPALRR